LNLSFQIDDQTLTDAFKDAGEIEAIKWEEDNGRFAGRGWVRFKNADSVDKAVDVAGTKVLGRPIVVRRASEVYCNRIFVRNLPQEVTEEQLRDFFADCGAITEVKWIEDRTTGAFKGSGFIQFSTVSEGKKAIAKHGSEFMGKQICCEYSRPLRQRPGGSESRTSTPGPGMKQERPKTRVFISNLDYNIDENKVKEFFKSCGDIRNIRWSERNGEFQCKGVVEFESAAAAQKAVLKTGEDLMGKNIRAEISNPPRRDRGNNENTVFIGNLPFDVTENEITQFANPGDVKAVRLVKDRVTSRFKGFGFVEFGSKSMAEKFVKEKVGARLRGRPIRVREMLEHGGTN